jgi:hypothetical protein
MTGAHNTLSVKSRQAQAAAIAAYSLRHKSDLTRAFSRRIDASIERIQRS